MPESELLECDRCRRPAKRRALYARQRGTGAAVLQGRFGGRCFYIAARAVADAGHTPETQEARIIHLRGRS